MADQIADHIQQSILEGNIRPGDRLIENDIAKQLDVSRTPTREAFRILASQGLVEINSNKGVRVTLITKSDLAELFEVRILLEKYCLRNFVRNATGAEIHNLETELKKMAMSVADNDNAAYLRHSVNFHTSFINKCQNKRLISIFEILKNNIHCAQIFYARKAVARQDSVQEHQAIWGAIKSRSIEKAETALSHHLENSYMRMIRLIDGDEINRERITSSMA
jgi:DNA-binding GntR family transcriptional regulator